MKLCSAGRLNSSNLAQCVNGTEALGGAGPNLIQSSLTRHDENGMASASILTTAGHLLFTRDAFGNLLALDPSTARCFGIAGREVF
jgi:hypothetical protein